MNGVPNENGSSYIQLLNEIYRSFNFFNNYFLNGKLTCPVILISSSSGEQMFGWHGAALWREQGHNIGEINICAEYLCRPPEEILETLLHEMAHLKNAQLGIKDINNQTQYHYKTFKIAAQSLGLNVQKNNKGYSITSLGDRAYEAIDKLSLNRQLFGIYRKIDPEEYRKIAAKQCRQHISISLRNNDKIKDALNILIKKSGSRVKAVENAIIAAAYGVNFNDVM